MQQRQIGPFSVSAIGLGCMNLSHAYGTPISMEQGERLLLAALDAGVTLFDTASLYGFGAAYHHDWLLNTNIITLHVLRQNLLGSRVQMEH